MQIGLSLCSTAAKIQSALNTISDRSSNLTADQLATLKLVDTIYVVESQVNGHVVANQKIPAQRVPSQTMVTLLNNKFIPTRQLAVRGSDIAGLDVAGVALCIGHEAFHIRQGTLFQAYEGSAQKTSMERAAYTFMYGYAKNMGYDSGTLDWIQKKIINPPTN